MGGGGTAPRGVGMFRGDGGGGEIAPFPIELSFDRVTDPNAPVRILKPEHLLMTEPNHIWERDFSGLGAGTRDFISRRNGGPEYTTLLSSNDAGEKPLDGGLLVADVGAGSFIYCSYDLHRLKLRAGVPGAYRLLANLLSYARVKRK